VDNEGNVFVTGWSDGGSGALEYATLAYSGAGVPMWTNRFHGPGEASDYAKAIAVDASGNVFVTGDSVASGNTHDYATVAYSGAGVPLWTNLYHGPGDGWDSATAIAVDKDGNVFVTGTSGGDYATLAYSGTGVPLWTNRYNGPANGSDNPTAITVGPSGEVFVTGYSTGTSGKADFATVAYSGAGIPLWTNRYNGPGNADDGPPNIALQSLAVDSGGNVVVTGYSWRTSNYTSSDYLTLAYSSSGIPLWTNRYNGPGNGEDIAFAAAVDKSGNVFVAGTSPGIGGVTIKYSSSVRAYLGIQSINNQAVLTWTNAGFSLQAGPSVSGMFTNVQGAASPYTNSFTGPQQYFKLRSL
jgi:hypothetical protein